MSKDYISEEVAKLLDAPEGEHYEFKEAKSRYGFDEAVHYCCALANCGGGKFVLGITDERPRKVVGSRAFEQPERTCKGLIYKLKIRVDFKQYEHDGMRILVFEVASRPVGLPVQADGIVWWREGDSLVHMPQEVMRRIYDESGHDFSGDICPDATIEDLDLAAIENFRDKWVGKSGNSQIRNLTVDQLLLDCGAISDKGVTYAALILFAKSISLKKLLPRAEVIFEYRSKNNAGMAQQREEFCAGLFIYYDRIWELINLRNDRQENQDGFHVFDIPTFNERVAREAVLNAVSHRSYQLPGSVYVRQYRDRLVVESPGGFPSGITLDNILTRQSPRNRLIAQILALCGLVDRAGQGVNMMYELSIREAKSLPDFSGSDAYFVSLTLNGLILDKGMLALLSKIGEEQLESFSTEDFLVIDALFHERTIRRNFRPYLRRLSNLGIVEHTGHGKYVLARSFYEVTGKPGVHTRIVGLDRETNKELILKHIKSNGTRGTPFGELQQVLPSHSRGQIQVYLRELQSEERIYSRGKTKGALWHVQSH